MSMELLLNLGGFLLDMVTMMPPFEAADLAKVPPQVLVGACLGSVVLLAIVMTVSGVKEVFGGNFLAAAVVVAIVLILGALSSWSILKSVFATSYPPLVIALRAAEGVLLGIAIRPVARLWHLVPFLLFATGIYFALRTAPPPAVKIALGVWSLIGIGTASFGWAAQASSGSDSPFRTPLAAAALFVVFASTTLYVQSPPIRFESLCFQCAFPAGLLIGLVSGKKQKGVPLRPLREDDRQRDGNADLAP